MSGLQFGHGLYQRGNRDSDPGVGRREQGFNSATVFISVVTKLRTSSSNAIQGFNSATVFISVVTLPMRVRELRLPRFNSATVFISVVTTPAMVVEANGS